MIRTLADRFWEKVDERGSDECWYWLASKRYGYGQIRCAGTMLQSHRVAWILSHGIIPKGMYVRHSCSNRACCNPKHLFLTTPSEGRKVQSLSERFWPKVNVRGPNKCWEWKGALQTSGYGMLLNERGKKTIYIGAHRAAWELTFGVIPEGLCVCHHCDNKLCVNPKHLFLGTITDNNRDAIVKGRRIRGRDGRFTANMEEVYERV